MEFRLLRTPLKTQDGYIIKLGSGNKQYSFNDVIALWKTNMEFAEFWRQSILKLGYPAVFWEVKPINMLTLQEDFECVILPAKQLENIHAQPEVFKQHFKISSPVANFSNLGNDAILIAPCPTTSPGTIKNYAHLISFLTNADAIANKTIWQSLAEEIESQLSLNNLWISTSGLGVYWLHIRLDSYPKYYQYQKYRI